MFEILKYFLLLCNIQCSANVTKHSSIVSKGVGYRTAQFHCTASSASIDFENVNWRILSEQPQCSPDETKQVSFLNISREHFGCWFLYTTTWNFLAIKQSSSLTLKEKFSHCVSGAVKRWFSASGNSRSTPVNEKCVYW